MDFKSTFLLESTSYPGVVVTLKRMGPKRRAEVELAVSGARAKQRELSVRYQAVQEKLVAAVAASPRDEDNKPIESRLSAEALAFGIERQSLADELSALARSQIQPAYVKAGVKAFGGAEPLTYDGKAATADLLCECGPDDLFDEVIEAINNNGYISPERKENLSSPSTSAGPEDGEAMNTTAAPAKPDDSTFPAAA